MKVGDYVQYGDPHGSIGRIVETHPALPHFHYVEYVYGRDKHGEVMTGLCGVQECMLMKSTKAEYEAKRDRKGFGS